jgi:hypothetical protein
MTDSLQVPPSRSILSARIWPVLVVCLFVGLTMVFTYPLWVHPTKAVLWHGSDTELFAWTLSWDVHALTHHPWSIFEANIYYPQAHTLGYSENLIGSALLAAPAILLTGNPILGINSVSILTTLLCGLGAYWLARRLGASRSAAVVAGIVFGFAPPRFLRLGQLHLGAVQWIPFGLAALTGYFDTGRRRDLWLAAAFFSLEALSSGHGAVFLVIAMLGLTAYRLIRGLRIDAVRRIRDLGVVGALLLLPAVLVVIEYQLVRHDVGLTRTLDDWVRTNFASFLTSPTYVDRTLNARFLVGGDLPMADLFPGYLPLLLAPLAFLWRRPAAHEGNSETAPVTRRVNDVPFYGLLTVVSLWAALPLDKPFGLWPYVYWLPGLNFIRTPSRITILTVLGLAILAALASDGLAARLRLSERVRAVVLGVLALLLVVEFAEGPLDARPYRVQFHPVDRAVALLQGRVAIAELPMEDPNTDTMHWERRQSIFMLHSMAHWQKTIHGYSGTRAPLHDELYDQLTRFPDEKSLSSLERIGVTHVVVHTDLYPAGEWPRVQSRIEQYGDRLALEHVVADGRIYRVVKSQ